MNGAQPTGALRALAAAAWRAAYNDGWRFSRTKAGLWTLLAQAAVAGLAAWRVAAHPPAVPAGEGLWLGFAEGWLVGLLMALLRGRERLFTGPLVTLVHLSPAPARTLVLLHVLRSLPGRAWFALLFCAALVPALGAGGVTGGPLAVRAAAVWLSTAAGGVLGHLTGTGALVGVVRRWPAALAAIPALAMVLFLGLVGLTLYVFTAGLWQLGAAPAGPPAPAGRPGPGLPAASAVLFALVGLVALAALVRPAVRRSGAPTPDAHREAWLAVREALDRGSRPVRSRWPAAAGGPPGALQALAWLLAVRNWFSLVRLGLWAAVLAMPFVLGPAPSRMEPSRAAALCIGMGLVAALFNYGEQAAALFSVDGERAAIGVLAGIRPAQLVLGKWLAALPLVAVAALTTLVWAAAAGCGPADVARLTAACGAIALAATTWLVGAAAFDAAPRPGGAAPEGEVLAAAFEQVPTRPGGIVGLAGAAVLAAAGVWLYLREPRWLAALAVPALAAALAGWRWVDRVWRRGALG